MILSDFKDKYRGHRVFFVGNGPSINQTPLHLMKDEYCFGTNKVCELFKLTDWRPTHYIATTSHMGFHRDWASALDEIAKTGIPCFLAEWYWSDEMPKWFIPPEGDNVIRLPTRKLRRPDGDSAAGWSQDVDKEVISHRGVVSTFLQLAWWMGFSPIYLVGCDLGYVPFSRGEPDPNHWSDDYDLKPRSAEACHIENRDMTEAHIAMSKIAEREGIVIYNATIGGALEAYERVDIHDILR